MVLEDDIILGKYFIEILNSLEKLPRDWEMINFCTDAALKPFGDFVYDIHRAAHPTKYANRTSAYLINLAGAQKLLRKAYPIKMPVDGLTGRTYITNLIHYAIYPQTVVLSDFQSDIWKDDSIVNLRKSKLSYCISMAKIFYRFIVRKVRWPS